MICANCNCDRNPRKMILPVKNYSGVILGYICKKCVVKGVAKVQREEKEHGKKYFK